MAEIANVVSNYLRSILNGGAPNGMPSKAFGEYRELIENLSTAYTNGGTVKVRELWDQLVRSRPKFAVLVAADLPEDEDWHVYTLENAYEERPPLRHVIDGLFPSPSLSIIYGAPGTIKSLLVADLAICLAAGLPPLPRPPAVPAPWGHTRRSWSAGPRP